MDRGTTEAPPGASSSSFDWTGMTGIFLGRRPAGSRRPLFQRYAPRARGAPVPALPLASLHAHLWTFDTGLCGVRLWRPVPNLSVNAVLNATRFTASPSMCWGNAPTFASGGAGKEGRGMPASPAIGALRGSCGLVFDEIGDIDRVRIFPDDKEPRYALSVNAGPCPRNRDRFRCWFPKAGARATLAAMRRTWRGSLGFHQAPPNETLLGQQPRVDPGTCPRGLSSCPGPPSKNDKGEELLKPQCRIRHVRQVRAGDPPGACRACSATAQPESVNAP
jgi:hypothetical protein